MAITSAFSLPSTRRALSPFLLCALLPIPVFAAEILLYSGQDFTGSFSQSSRSEPWLGSEGARSIRIGTGIWDVCTQRNYSGECQRLGPGDYRSIANRHTYTIRSVRHVSQDNPVRNSQFGYADAQVQLFESADFRGRSYTLSQNASNLPFLVASVIVHTGTWELCTSRDFGDRCQALPPGQYRDLGPQLNHYRIRSARIVSSPSSPNRESSPSVYSPGTRASNSRVAVFLASDFAGSAINIDQEIHNLQDIQGLNDRIYSLRIYGGTWEVCRDRDFGPPCMRLEPGEYPRLHPQFSGQISSLRRVDHDYRRDNDAEAKPDYEHYPPNAGPSHQAVWLFEHRNFEGRSLRANHDVSDLSSSGMNDTVSSLFIAQGTWQFCVDADYRSHCFTLSPGQYPDMPKGTNDSLSSFRRIR